MRIYTLLFSLLIFFAFAVPAQARLDPARELNRATVNADKWCRTNFRNATLTPFIGCNFALADPRGGLQNGNRVPLWQKAQGSKTVSPCGPEPCINEIGWYAQRKLTVYIDHTGHRRVRHSSWRCFPQGTLAPFNWPGLRCFAPTDPRFP